MASFKDSSSASAVPRTIPGFSQPTSQAPKPRKRSSKKSVATVGPQTTGTFEPVDEEQAAVDVDDADDSLVKRTNAVEQTKKRLRAQNKKLQRLDAYEAKEDINEDQRRALAGRSTIDAVVKELNELLAILQAEEVEDIEREKRVEAAQEKKTARAVEAAVEASKREAQSQLVLLCQFLHLRALFSPNQPSSFAPPVLPPAITQATGQEVAAVHTLFDELSNGPLLGGHGDAIEKIHKIATGSQDQVIDGVPFSRIQQLIHGLTAPPEEANLETPLDSPALGSSSVPGPADSVVVLVDGEKEAHAAPSFLNESEIEPAAPPADKVASWADEIADSAQAPPPSGPATPTNDILSFTGQSTPSAEMPSPIAAALGRSDGATPENLSAVTPPATNGTESQTLDWAADEEGGGQLPHLPELAPAVPIVQQDAGASNGGGSTGQQPRGDGFQSARQPRRGNGFRGGENGQRRGSFRGRGEGRGRGGRGGNGARGGRGRGGAAPNPAASAASPSA
ncbi:uncharacterized protein JCM15063_006156 [Sporobolomyces koalae]|uniref:uncharacterized protein n=1 Tax=Sporobolomyces koalae TaxID=500713 RepID=UPI00318241B0